MRRFLLSTGHNTLILLAVNVVTAISGFFIAALLGRGLGDAGFGQFTFVMTWLLTILTIVEFGISTVLTRDLARTPANTSAYFVNSLAAKWVLAVPASLFLLISAKNVIPFHSPQAVLTLQWGIPFLFAGLAYSSLTAVFKAHQVMAPILYSTVIGQGSSLMGVIILVTSHRSLPTIIIWLGLSQWLQFCFAAILYRSRLHYATTGGNIKLSFMWQLFLLSWPFALAGFLAALQLRANTLLLAYLDGDQALGWYSAAGRFIDAGKQLPGAFFVAVLPALSAEKSVIRLSKTVRVYQAVLLGVSLAAAIFIYMFAESLITITYGPGYQPAISILQVMAISLIPAFQNSLLIIYLYSRGDERFVNLLIGVGIAINLGLCYGLIPALGAIGTALALLIADTLLYLPYRWRAGRFEL